MRSHGMQWFRVVSSKCGIQADFQATISGCQVRAGISQSIPSVSIANFARRQGCHAVFGLGPHEPATLQTFGPENQCLAVPEKNLQQMIAFATKDEPLTA